MSAPHVFCVFAAAVVALDCAGGTGGVNVTEPASGSARPRFEKDGSVWYGKRFFRIVVGASGSFFERKSAHARLPFFTPKRFSIARTSRALFTSAPPPLPKMPP